MDPVLNDGLGKVERNTNELLRRMEGTKHLTPHEIKRELKSIIYKLQDLRKRVRET